MPKGSGTFPHGDLKQLDTFYLLSASMVFISSPKSIYWRKRLKYLSKSKAAFFFLSWGRKSDWDPIDTESLTSLNDSSPLHISNPELSIGSEDPQCLKGYANAREFILIWKEMPFMVMKKISSSPSMPVVLRTTIWHCLLDIWKLVQNVKSLHAVDGKSAFMKAAKGKFHLVPSCEENTCQDFCGKVEDQDGDVIHSLAVGVKPDKPSELNLISVSWQLKRPFSFTSHSAAQFHPQSQRPNMPINSRSFSMWVKELLNIRYPKGLMSLPFEGVPPLLIVHCFSSSLCFLGWCCWIGMERGLFVRPKSMAEFRHGLFLCPWLELNGFDQTIQPISYVWGLNEDIDPTSNVVGGVNRSDIQWLKLIRDRDLLRPTP